jgi:hypothetical protein
MYPNMEALQAWRNDPAYAQVRRVGEKYAKYHTFAVEAAPSPWSRQIELHIELCFKLAERIRMMMSERISSRW